MDKIELFGTTDASGDLTVTSDIHVTGGLYAVRWIDGDLADGVDAVLSVVDGDGNALRTLLTLTDANDDAWHEVLELASDNVGADLTGQYQIPMVDGRLKLVVSSGGNAKSGGLIAYVLGTL